MSWMRASETTACLAHSTANSTYLELLKLKLGTGKCPAKGISPLAGWAEDLFAFAAPTREQGLSDGCVPGTKRSPDCLIAPQGAAGCFWNRGAFFLIKAVHVGIANCYGFQTALHSLLEGEKLKFLAQSC